MEEGKTEKDKIFHKNDKTPKKTSGVQSWFQGIAPPHQPLEEGAPGNLQIMSEKRKNDAKTEWLSPPGS